MYKKTIDVPIDWLKEIDGMTVAKAIEYLSTFDQSHILNTDLDGDTHGVSLTSSLYYEVPMSNAEIYSQLSNHYNTEIRFYEDAKRLHIKEGRQSRVESCEINLKRLYAKLEEAKQKYCEK